MKNESETATVESCYSDTLIMPKTAVYATICVMYYGNCGINDKCRIYVDCHVYWDIKP